MPLLFPWKHTPPYLWQLIHRSMDLRQRLLDVVNPVMQRNTYYAHPENLLLRMVIDDIRMLAAKQVEVARATRSAQPVRVFKVPKVDFPYKDYSTLIIID